MFAAVVGRQLWGRGPPVWALFVAGGVLTVATGALSLPLAEAALANSATVLVFLFALFLFASALEASGALDHVARWLVGRAPRPQQLPVVLFVGFGIASAFLVNDALVVIGVPILLAVARRLNVAPRPLLLTLAFAVTVGSSLTPFGNPQNLLVALDSGLGDPVTTFLRYLLVPTAVNLGLGAVYLRWRFSAELTPSGPVPAPVPRPLLPATGWRERLVRHPVLFVFPGTMVVLVTLDVTAAIVHGPQVPIWMTAAGGASVLLLLAPDRLRVVRTVNWEILLLFAGLFVVVGAAVHGGLVTAGERAVRLPGPREPLAGLATIMGSSVVGCQLVSNVPWVAVELPVLGAAGYTAATPVAWVALAAASTLSGNVTLLGAASNLIVVDLADKSGVRIGLRTFVRDGLPIAALSLLVLFACLALGL